MDEPKITTALVKRLITAQFPQWAALAVRPVAQSGWDNRTFHLGPDMAVRLPSAARYAAQTSKEQTWLPKLANHVPLPIPAPLAQGVAGEGYPFDWSVMRWLSGDTLANQGAATQQATAKELGGFLNALRDVPSDGGPVAGMHNFYRGGDLRIYDQEVRHALAQLGDSVDQAAILRRWTKACTSAWAGAPVWVHGDVAAGNLLCADGKLSAVIDFGCCGIGDPACDLTIAWTVYEGRARTLFRETIGLDPATWDRAAGWCLWKALLNACQGAAGGHETLDAVLKDTHF